MRQFALQNLDDWWIWWITGAVTLLTWILINSFFNFKNVFLTNSELWENDDTIWYIFILIQTRFQHIHPFHPFVPILNDIYTIHSLRFNLLKYVCNWFIHLWLIHDSCLNIILISWPIHVLLTMSNNFCPQLELK